MNNLFLEELLSTSSPSGYEQEIIAVIKKHLPSSLNIKIDNLGNSIVSNKSNSTYNVLIVAHCDEVGFQVVKIDDNGYIRFRPIGGIRPTYLPGSSVVILNKNNYVNGCISYVPIHVLPQEGNSEVNYNDLWIDIGVTSKSEAENLIYIGDYIVFNSNFHYSANKKRLFAKGLDNKLGVFVMVEVFKKLMYLDLPVTITIAATVQEELGCRGCQAVINQINPDLVLVLDAGISGDIPIQINNRYGVLDLGKGPGINYNPTNNKKLNDLLSNTALKNNIIYQKSAGYQTNKGTENAVIQTLLNGIVTSHISIPVRNMHMAQEICDIKDIENTILLIVETIKNISNIKNKEFAFTPW